MKDNPKIVCALMVQNVENWIKPCLESILGWVDRVVIVDGGSTDNTLKIVSSFNDERIEVHYVRYENEFKGADGKQRNEYLRILQEKYIDWWALVIDGDEVVGDNGFLLRKLALEYEENNVTCVDMHMVHFIWNLGMIDDSAEKHFCIRRFFKVTPDLTYPEMEHTLIEGYEGIHSTKCEEVTLYHYGYVNGVSPVITKFLKHIHKSEVHNKDFLQGWKTKHLFGTYPTKKFVGEHPRPIKEKFFL